MPSVLGYGSQKPTSAAVESEFHDLKNRILKDVSKPIRIDKFISRHISTFSGKIKIGLAGHISNNVEPVSDRTVDQLEENPNNSSDTEEVIIDKESLEIEESLIQKKNKRLSSSGDEFEELHELRQEENWKGKNNKKKRSNYTDPMPHFDPTLQPTNTLPLILNGTSCKNVRFDGKIFVLTNTCAFDSICQIFVSAIKYNPHYKKVVFGLNVPILKTASILIEKGLKSEFYNERALLLYNLPIYNAEKGKSNVITIKGDINIGNLGVALFTASPSCIVTSRCSQCKKSSTRSYVTISANIDSLKEGFHKLNEAVENSFPDVKECCGELKEESRNYGPHLLIETDIGENNLICLQNISLQLNLNTVCYELAGIVTYSGSFRKNSMGHYTACVPVSENYIQYNDSSKKAFVRDKNYKINAHLCIYIVN